MKVIDKRVYTGRNIYSHKPCMRFKIDFEKMEDIPTKDIRGFNERLLKAFPGLSKHHCSLGYEGGFKDRLDEGTYLPHVLEHIIIEMQNTLGFTNVKYGKARVVDGSIYYVIFQYELEEAGLLCGECAIKCLENFINDEDFNIEEELKDIEKNIARVRLGPSTLGIYDEAKKREIPVIRIGNESMLQLGYGKLGRRIEATITDATSCIAVDISCDKALTREMLKIACIPVAPGDCVDNIEDAIIAADNIGYPLVVKPVDGNQGKGVTVDIRNSEELKVAYNMASKYNKSVIVEKFIKGRDYRVLVINGKVSAVSLRLPPCVIGDGVHNINELIEIENNNPIRGYGHEKPLTKIKIDDVMINYLKNKNIGLDYIPKIDEKIILRFNANISTGGVAKDCTDIIHPDNIEAAVKAAEIIGLDIAGIDICTPDISRSIYDDDGVVIEVNSAPGIRMHMYPSLGRKRNAAAGIIDYLFPCTEKTSVPVVSVTGTNGKTTTTRMIAHIFSLMGMCVGMTTTSGIYIDGKLVMKGDNTGPESAKTILMNRNIDIAVLETARGGIVKRGLGYDTADVGVITNISEDHLGIDGINTMEELVYVKSLVVEAIKKNGFAVINADDPSVNALNERIKNDIIYFSMNSDNIIIKKHILDGGRAVFLKDDYICTGNGQTIESIIDVKEIPSTIGGRLEYNIQNAMAAASACIALNVDVENIAKGLRTFFLDENQNPGRFNIYDLEKLKVVVDYGHNIEGYKAVIKGLKKLDANRLVGIIGVPGDRLDENIVSVGSICGSAFDYIYIKEDVDKRGRVDGEVAKLLECGVIKSGKSKDKYNIVLNEGDALKKAMENALPGDCIAVFYEDYDTIMKVIQEYRSIKNIIIGALNVI